MMPCEDRCEQTGPRIMLPCYGLPHRSFHSISFISNHRLQSCSSNYTEFHAPSSFSATAETAYVGSLPLVQPKENPDNACALGAFSDSELPTCTKQGPGSMLQYRVPLPNKCPWALWVVLFGWFPALFLCRKECSLCR